MVKEMVSKQFLASYFQSHLKLIYAFTDWHLQYHHRRPPSFGFICLSDFVRFIAWSGLATISSIEASANSTCSSSFVQSLTYLSHNSGFFVFFTAWVNSSKTWWEKG